MKNVGNSIKSNIPTDYLAKPVFVSKNKICTLARYIFLFKFSKSSWLLHLEDESKHLSLQNPLFESKKISSRLTDSLYHLLSHTSHLAWSQIYHRQHICVQLSSMQSRDCHHMVNVRCLIFQFDIHSIRIELDCPPVSTYSLFSSLRISQTNTSRAQLAWASTCEHEWS